jgi:hypothetical protein
MATQYIITAQRFNGYKELLVEIKADIPTNLAALPNKTEIAHSYMGKYPIAKVDGSSIYFNVKISQVADGATVAQIETLINTEIQQIEYVLSQFQLEDVDTIIGMTKVGTGSWTYIPPTPITPTP